MRGNRVNYSHVWPRDGALVAQVLDAMGDHEAANRYFEWCRPLITERRPFFLQKYNADGTFACSWHPWNVELPIQEDETALTVIALCEHIAVAPGAEVSHWAQMLTWMCDFLMEYVEIGFALPAPATTYGRSDEGSTPSPSPLLSALSRQPPRF